MDWNDVLYEGIAWRVLYRGIAWRGSWRVNHETSHLINPAGRYQTSPGQTHEERSLARRLE